MLGASLLTSIFSAAMGLQLASPCEISPHQYTASAIGGIMQSRPLGASLFVFSRRKPRLMKPARRDDLLEQGGGRVNRSANSITPVLRATGLHLRQQHPLPGESRIGLAAVDPQSSDRGRSARRTLISQAGAVHRQQNRVPNRHRLLKRPASEEVQRSNTIDQPLRQQTT